jgi:hypothetical protein
MMNRFDGEESHNLLDDLYADFVADADSAMNADADSVEGVLKCAMCFDKPGEFGFSSCSRLCLCFDCFYNLSQTDSKCPVCRPDE